MAANTSRSHSDNSWEELSVPPEIELGTALSVDRIQEESVNMGTVEIADEATPKMKVLRIDHVS